MNSLSNYVSYYDFNCHVSLFLHPELQQLPFLGSNYQQRYRFNSLEECGRRLQEPFVAALSDLVHYYDDLEEPSPSNLIKVCVVIGAIFFSVFAACGYILESIGAYANPCTQLRKEAFNKLQDIYQCLNDRFQRSDIDFYKIATYQSMRNTSLRSEEQFPLNEDEMANYEEAIRELEQRVTNYTAAIYSIRIRYALDQLV